MFHCKFPVLEQGELVSRSDVSPPASTEIKENKNKAELEAHNISGEDVSAQ